MSFRSCASWRLGGSRPSSSGYVSEAEGMPRWKRVSCRRTLHREALPYRENADDSLFGQQLITQAAPAGMRTAEIAVSTRHFAEASSVGFRRAVIQGSW